MTIFFLYDANSFLLREKDIFSLINLKKVLYLYVINIVLSSIFLFEYPKYKYKMNKRRIFRHSVRKIIWPFFSILTTMSYKQKKIIYLRRKKIFIIHLMLWKKKFDSKFKNLFSKISSHIFHTPTHNPIPIHIRVTLLYIHHL